MRPTPAVRSSRASGSGDWWNDVEITAASGPSARTRSVSRARSAASTGGGAPRIHGLAQVHTSSTPGSKRAASAPARAGRRARATAPRRTGEEHDPLGAGCDRPHEGTLEEHVSRVVEPGDED